MQSLHSQSGQLLRQIDRMKLRINQRRKDLFIGWRHDSRSRDVSLLRHPKHAVSHNNLNLKVFLEGHDGLYSENDEENEDKHTRHVLLVLICESKAGCVFRVL